MKILVTGGAGYIGSHTCKALAMAGHEPIVYDNLSMGHKWAVQWGPLIIGDLRDQITLNKTLIQHKIEAVIHFAAKSLVGESIQHPLQYFDNNMVGSYTLLNTLLQNGIDKIVFSSTCATYGTPNYIPIDEIHPTQPINPYGESKLIIEKMLYWLGTTKKLRWVALRYFNAAGADPDGKIGENHNPETHLIPLALKACADGKYQLQIMGTDYPTFDGTAIRDYIHVNDLATAHLLALNELEKQPLNDIINLGTGIGASVQQVVNTVETITGNAVRCIKSPRRPGDPPELVANSKKATSILGWQPTRSNLELIITDAWNWYISGYQQTILKI